MWTLPYYVCGAMAIIFFHTSIAVGQWPGPVLSLPMLVLCYVSWRTWVRRRAELE